MAARSITRVEVSDVLDVAPEALWAVLRDFNALPDYHPFFSTSFIENDWPADRIGCVRNFRGTDGQTFVRERLLGLDDDAFRCRYEIIEANTKIDRYVSEVRLWQVTETGQTFGLWWAEFAIDSTLAAAFAGRVSDTFRLGLRGAAEVAARRAAP